MQNLEIKYARHSAHLAYLSLFDLQDQDHPQHPPSHATHIQDPNTLSQLPQQDWVPEYHHWEAEHHHWEAEHHHWEAEHHHWEAEHHHWESEHHHWEDGQQEWKTEQQECKAEQQWSPPIEAEKQQSLPREAEQQWSPSQADFTCFVQRSLGLKGRENWPWATRALSALAVGLFGEIFEHCYHTHSNFCSFRRHKWTVLGHFLVLFWGLWMAPLVMVLLGLCWAVLGRGQVQSQLVLWAQLPRQASQALLGLKQALPAGKHGWVDCLLARLVVRLQRVGCWQARKWENPLDRIDQIVFELGKGQRSNKPPSLLLGSTALQQKWKYWQLKLQNVRVQRIIASIQQMIVVVAGRTTRQNVGGIAKRSSFNHLHSQVLVWKRRVLASGKSQALVLQSKILLVLAKEVAQRRICRPLQPDLASSSQQQTASSLAPVECFPVFVERRREHPPPVCYQDEEPAPYFPEEFRSISLRLERMLEQHQQGEGQKRERTRGGSDVCPEKERVKLERKSFGIPVAPPAVQVQEEYYL